MYSTRVHGKSTGRPTRDDVAKAAKISGATVSRVLSGRTDVPILPETRAKVLEAAKALGYTPNNTARALSKGKTGIIGFWMSLAYSRYRGQVLDCMRTLLQGVEVTSAVTDIDEEFHFAHSFDRALRVPADGIIAFDISASLEAFDRTTDGRGPNTPFVSMGAYWSEKRSYVGIDLRRGADEAMNHLLLTGRRRISYLAPITSDLLNSGPRYQGYFEAMDHHGFEPKSIGVDSFRYLDIKNAVEQLVSSNSLPEAILCLNDEAAISMSQVLQGAGIKVGEDVALVGFDGIEEAEYAAVPITSVSQPFHQMCALAWDFLQVQITDPEAAPLQKILVPQLVVRESTSK